VQYGGSGKKDPRPSPFVYVISPGFLAAMGMHVTGRDIAWSDNDSSELVMIVNQKCADFLFPNHDAVGRIVNFTGVENVRIIGVVPDLHESDVESDPGWQAYISIGQKQWGPNYTHLVVRSQLPPSAFAPAVFQKIREINPGQPRNEFLPLQSYVDHATSPRRFFALLVGLFAALGLTLAMLGIYGVISYSVTRQTQEIGIRMALGATREKVQMDVISKTLRLALIGIVIGTVASFIVARAISSMLFGTQPTDPVSFAAMVVLLVGVAFFAGFIPARRASRINPMAALRSN
jgi:predicted permease